MRHSRLIQNPPLLAASRRPTRRSGTSVLELVIGAIILSVFFSIMGPMLHWIQTLKRTNERHLAAMQELSMQMETLSAIPVAELSMEYLSSLTVSETTQTLIPDAELTATMTPGEQQMQRLSLAIFWTNDGGRPVEPKRLTAWFPLEPKGGTE